MYYCTLYLGVLENILNRFLLIAQFYVFWTVQYTSWELSPEKVGKKNYQTPSPPTMKDLEHSDKKLNSLLIILIDWKILSPL